ncbi:MULTISPECIES: phosphate signaling complex protein PhoU [Paenibacillus]|uniref:Phosphate-specific transport system accessory protein PhoU n=1 Tax=Paenibacillus naphthalenovorans TaxID=162209 RepID=A0A0U2W058_9BACL|nr:MULTISPECIES: phosphate signaling complex protein PhoU [Paenibacillus]ALS20885.1 PhoU family transcriptional regulator [Paenibacillus naphthalenovorans]GCL70916.1 phosphate transport system regulatory protein PhoU [Paenibacillus naphthalenovorans]SDI18950.1 phosphate transport system protein [Paenibacillus naphthalenovorans]
MDTRSNFHQAVEELQEDLLKMGGLVENHISLAVEALGARDEQLGRRIIEQDDRIDELMLRIEENCLRLIALQQPMASDLRIIGMALKISTDLERIGDHAVDIAKIAIRMSGDALVKPLEIIPNMALLAKDMLHESLLAYTERDIHRAAALAEKDDQVDKLYSSVVDEIIGMMNNDPGRNRQLSQLMMAALYLERVADHTTNIGEGVIYMVTGKRKDLNI